MSQSVLHPRGLCGNELKLLAILAMTVDHIAWSLFPGYSMHPLALLMHAIGRLTCPIMCYFIAEGYHYTRSFQKYALRLLLLAIVSHFAYQFFSFGGHVGWRVFLPFAYGNVLNQTSVIWALLGGLLMLRVNDLDCSALQKTALILLLCLVTLPADWSCIAPLCILSIGANRGNPGAQLRWCLFYVSLYVRLPVRAASSALRRHARQKRRIGPRHEAAVLCLLSPPPVHPRPAPRFFITF